MNKDGCCISTNDSPVFVCKRCAAVLRVLFYEAEDEIRCSYCSSVMAKTSFKLADYEGYLMYGRDADSRQFQQQIFEKYVRDSGEFEPAKAAEREKAIICMTNRRFPFKNM